VLNGTKKRRELEHFTQKIPVRSLLRHHPLYYFFTVRVDTRESESFLLSPPVRAIIKGIKVPVQVDLVEFLRTHVFTDRNDRKRNSPGSSR
jgi:hypothetical protein